MDIFFSGGDVEELYHILSQDCTFRGPFYEFDSAEDYINSLKSDPPQNVAYEILKSFEDVSSACLIYRFSKSGICTLMAQLFECSHDRIRKIVLIFDTGAFT